MPKRSSKPKKQKDTQQLARSVLDAIVPEGRRKTGRKPFSIAASAAGGTEPTESGKNPAAVALGRLGGKKGGIARAKKLTAERRSAIAKKAAAKRWSRKNKNK
jgi:hypothetical protein